MSYPEGLPFHAFCFIEGHNFDRGSVCPNCGERLRCTLCGQFLRSGRGTAHADACPVLTLADDGRSHR